jgi:hypothetical protein
MKGEKVLKG